MIVNIDQIKENPNNPRIIKDEKFKKLVKSIKEFPEMLAVRKLVCTPDYVVLGGNMRLRALREAKVKQVDIDIVDWDSDKQKRFVIEDNVSFGEWDYEELIKEWNEIDLQDWGLDLPVVSELDYSDKNKEIDIDALDETMTIKLNFTSDEYWIVKEQLLKIALTPEQAVWKLLGNE
jgi:ParB-like chromosome segregation protein Spo0J